MNEIETLATKEILFFLDHYGIKNDQGQLLDFKDHAYLWDIYEDWTPKQAILKAAQIGFSTTANIKALWLAKNKGMDIIYSLPSASDIKDFVSGKTNRLIDNNPIFQEWVADKDSIEQKRVGNNVIYFKGTWTERAAIATPADLYISDETDRSKQDIVTQYKTRLQHSKYGYEWYFSNPSAPGHGVDKHWQASDQKHWFIKCQGCGLQQFMTMENIMFRGSSNGRTADFDPANGGSIPSPLAYYGCSKCRNELDRRKGQWVRRWKGKEISGYWISALMAPWISAASILDKKKEYSEEQFTNFVLGQPYVGKGNVLLRAMFEQNLIQKINPQDTREIIGVDTGNAINYVIGNKYGMFFYDESPDYEPIKRRLRARKETICVIDGGGDFRGARVLREEFPNRVFLCYFGRDRKNDELIKWNDKDGTVVADRNKMLQLCVDEFTERRMPVYGTKDDWHGFLGEWMGMYRTTEVSDIGPPVTEWHKPSSGRCDYPFAQVYMRIGLDRFLEASSTFHDPTGEKIGSVGIEVRPDGTAFMPKR